MRRNVIFAAVYCSLVFVALLSLYYSRRETVQTEPAVASSTTNQVVIYPSDDAFVYKNAPRRNYGRKSTIEVDGSPEKSIYLKFDLSQLKDANPETVKLYLTTSTATGSTSPNKHYLAYVSNNNWDEKTITYVSRPTVTKDYAVEFYGGKAGQEFVIDLTSGFRAIGAKTVSLAIVSTGSDGLDLYSKENSSGKPRIVATLPGSTTPEPPDPTDPTPPDPTDPTPPPPPDDPDDPTDPTPPPIETSGIEYIYATPVNISGMLSGVTYYVSTVGSSSGNGSELRPWDLTTALSGANGAIKPGDVVYLKSGKYGTGGPTKYFSSIKGTSAKPIIFRNYPGHKVTIDAGIDVKGDYVWLWGLEITNTLEKRITESKNRPAGINLYGTGSRVINCIVHDTGHPGIGFWALTDQGNDEIYGTIIWGIGSYEVEDGNINDPWRRGSGVYAQHESLDKFARLSEIIAFKNFTTGTKAYSENSYANNFIQEGNVLFNNGHYNLFIDSGSNPAKNIKIQSNYTYRTKSDTRTNERFGWQQLDNNDIDITNNYFVGGYRSSQGVLSLKRWKNFNITGNTVVGTTYLGSYIPSGTKQTQVWNTNKYFGGGSTPFLLSTDIKVYEGGTLTTVDSWKSKTGFDKDSTFSSAYPTKNKVVVRTNKYEPNRAHVVVYNWEKKPSVALDLSKVLTSGKYYEVKDVQNYYGTPVKSGTYSGGVVEVPLTITATSKLTAQHEITDVPLAHTGPEFFVFVVSQ